MAIYEYEVRVTATQTVTVTGHDSAEGKTAAKDYIEAQLMKAYPPPVDLKLTATLLSVKGRFE